MFHLPLNNWVYKSEQKAFIFLNFKKLNDIWSSWQHSYWISSQKVTSKKDEQPTKPDLHENERKQWLHYIMHRAVWNTHTNLVHINIRSLFICLYWLEKALQNLHNNLLRTLWPKICFLNTEFSAKLMFNHRAMTSADASLLGDSRQWSALGCSWCFTIVHWAL